MKTHVLRFRAVDKDSFNLIKTGTKSIETRAATPRYAKIEPGDELEIHCGSQRLLKRVKAVQHYDSVESIFQSADWSRVMPGVDSLDVAKATYFAYPGYREKIDRFGIQAFHLE